MEKPRLGLTLRGVVAILAIVLCAAFWFGLATCALAAPASDRAAMAVINKINRQANVAVRHGTPWPADVMDGVWDCENYAGLKLHLLIEAGYGHAVRGFHVTTSWGERHAVLEVTLPSGRAVVLDNLTPWVLPRGETGHTDWAAAYIQRWALPA